MGAFGEKLRKQREQRGLELEAISNTTKISVRMLRALEEEHFDQLPGGVFNKGFVRAYSRQVGLDAEETVTDYLAALRESQIQAQQILPDFRSSPERNDEVTPRESRDAGPLAKPHIDDADDGDKHVETEFRDASRSASSGREQKQTRSDRRKADRRGGDAAVGERRNADRDRVGGTKRSENFPAAPPFPTAPEKSQPTSFRFSRTQLVVPLLLIAIALAAWASRHHRASAAKPIDAAKNSSGVASSRVASSSVISSKPPSTQSSATMAPPSATSLDATKTYSIAATGSGASTTKSSAGANPAAGPASSETTAVTSTAPARADVSAIDHPVGKHPGEASTHSTTAQAPATFTVLIRAEKTSWVQISADGKAIAQETLIAPAHTSVRATREIVVRAGNAAGISFLLNGKEILTGGNEGEVKTFAFDATGVRVLSQAQTPATNR